MITENVIESPSVARTSVINSLEGRICAVAGSTPRAAFTATTATAAATLQARRWRLRPRRLAAPLPHETSSPQRVLRRGRTFSNIIGSLPGHLREGAVRQPAAAATDARSEQEPGHYPRMCRNRLFFRWLRRAEPDAAYRSRLRQPATVRAPDCTPGSPEVTTEREVACRSPAPVASRDACGVLQRPPSSSQGRGRTTSSTRSMASCSANLLARRRTSARRWLRRDPDVFGVNHEWRRLTIFANRRRRRPRRGLTGRPAPACGSRRRAR